MRRMNWKQTIQDLLDAGMSQTEIARLCKCGRSTINELLHKDSPHGPRFELGQRLQKLHQRKVKRTKEKA